MTNLDSPSSALRARVWIVLAAILMTGPSLVAHDMWIEPTAFRPDVGSIVGARLKVGEDFLGDPIPRNPDLIDQLIGVDSSGPKPLVGRDGADPAGMIRAAQAGLIILGYQSKPSPVQLSAEKFNQYLSQEGLDGIAALRASRNQTNDTARELFSRCAKSLVLVGSASETQVDRRIGFTLELVAERNPYTLAAGQELPVSLIYGGKPLAGTLVVAINRLNPSAKLSARTDNQGRVKFRLAGQGAWLIKAVHMVPAPAGAGADWTSFWASLTFEVRGSGGTP